MAFVGMTASHDMVEIQHVQDALTASYNPQASNDDRQTSLKYLTDLKSRPEAPKYGFTIASDLGQQPFARHFGLSLLETAIRYRWNEHDADEATTLRQWVIQLAQDIRPQDPPYFRNKVASLWAEVAKREWAASWMNMDELLVALWEVPDGDKLMVNRMLVLHILETLSVDICIREETVAMLRQEELGRSLNEIMIPPGILQAHLEDRGTAQEVRCPGDGWLAKLCTFLSSLAGAFTKADPTISTAAIMTLEALKPTVTWIRLNALLEPGCVECLFQTLAYGDTHVQRVSMPPLLPSILHG